MAAKDPTTRRLAASAGGRARVAKANPADMTATRQAGAARTNSPTNLAHRIARAWSTLTPDQRAEIRLILMPILVDRP